jgi:hypothetical protein
MEPDNCDSFCRKIWYEEIVPVFLERFLLAVLATVFAGVVIFNTMQIDGHYRIGIGVVLMGMAYIIGHAVYQSSQKARSTAENRDKIPAGKVRTGDGCDRD